MIRFEDLQWVDGYPVYLQIVRFIQRGILSGTVQDGDELPSRRQLSVIIGVNPNTIQKAYRMLEDVGLIVSQAGAGSTVTVTDTGRRRLEQELIGEGIRMVIGDLKEMGLTLDDSQALLARWWDEGGHV